MSSRAGPGGPGAGAGAGAGAGGDAGPSRSAAEAKAAELERMKRLMAEKAKEVQARIAALQAAKKRPAAAEDAAASPAAAPAPAPATPSGAAPASGSPASASFALADIQRRIAEAKAQLKAKQQQQQQQQQRAAAGPQARAPGRGLSAELHPSLRPAAAAETGHGETALAPPPPSSSSSSLPSSSGALVPAASLSAAALPAGTAPTAAEAVIRQLPTLATSRANQRYRENQRRSREAALQQAAEAERARQQAIVDNPLLRPPSPDAAADADDAHFDPSLAAAASSRRGARGRGPFHFAKPGTYVREAERQRRQQQEQHAVEQIEQAAAAAAAQGLRPAEVMAPHLLSDHTVTGSDFRRTKTSGAALTQPTDAAALDPVLPDYVERWDFEVLPGATYVKGDAEAVLAALQAHLDTRMDVDAAKDDDDNDEAAAADAITNLVQHPPPLPPGKPAVLPVKPQLMLTARERKRLRRQRRQETQNEKQDMIRMGLLPPEEPRLTLKNFMRTLGQAAAQDPTGAEARVRAQMAARRERHEARIAAEKVSPAERRARETAKRRADADLATAQGRCHVAVFRLRDLRSKKLLHKLDASAREHFITGMSVVHPTGGLQLVIAEGGPQAIKAYKTLMLRRIAWHEDDALAERSQPDAYLPGKRPGVRHLPPDGILPEGVAPPAPGEGANACALVWEGILPKRSCEGFRTRRCATEAACLRTLRECGYEHFWKAAQADAQAEIA